MVLQCIKLIIWAGIVFPHDDPIAMRGGELDDSQ